MAKLKLFVTDQQWIRLEPWRPKPQPSPRGRPKPRGNRQVFDGIIWVLRSGAGWNYLPDRYPSASTCQRRLQPWENQGVWLKIWPKFLSELDQQGQLDWEETLADGSLAWAKKGPRPWKDQSREGWMVVVDGQGVPVGADLDSASASEIKLLEATIEKIAGPKKGGGRPWQTSCPHHSG